MTRAFMELHTVNVSSCWRCPNGTLGGQSLREFPACQPATVQKIAATPPTLVKDPELQACICGTANVHGDQSIGL